MQLSIAERLTLSGILPKESSYILLKVISDLKMALFLSEEELAEIKLKETRLDDKQVTYTWDSSKDPMKDVSIGERAEDLIKEELKTLDKEKRLEERHLSLYEKFVEKK